MVESYIIGKDKLNAAFVEVNSNLKVSNIRGVCASDRWSKIISTGKLRDIKDQIGYITFERKISDEVYLNFSLYFPRFDFNSTKYKTIYKIFNSKLIFNGVIQKKSDESNEGWTFTQIEKEIFVKWYNCINLQKS
jgi:hypothetical protein